MYLKVELSLPDKDNSLSGYRLSTSPSLLALDLDESSGAEIRSSLFDGILLRLVLFFSLIEIHLVLDSHFLLMPLLSFLPNMTSLLVNDDLLFVLLLGNQLGIYQVNSVLDFGDYQENFINIPIRHVVDFIGDVVLESE